MDLQLLNVRFEKSFESQYPWSLAFVHGTINTNPEVTIFKWVEMEVR